jgi:hypothetical protein
MSFKIKTCWLIVFAAILAAGIALPSVQPVRAMHEHEHRHVSIDVKPGSYPNPVNLNSQGVVPVALFGSMDFDVSMIDIASVIFGPMHQHDMGAPVERFSFQDVNGDGFMDIVFKFSTQLTGLTTADTQACLHGMTMGGEHFCGHDSVVVRE